MRIIENSKLKSSVAYDGEFDFLGVEKLVQSQQRIRWILFLDGYLVLEWEMYNKLTLTRWVVGRRG